MSKIKVLIVDDSAIVRSTLESSLSADPEIEVVGSAPDPFVARDKILKLRPDVITLDIEMPRMDGLTFLEKLMTYYPIPVIIVSSVTTQDPFAVVKALEIGAFAVVNKPGNSLSVGEVIEDLKDKIRSVPKVKGNFEQKFQTVKKRLEKKKPVSAYLSQVRTTDKIIAIGSSTGGTVALEYLLTSLPQNLPPILIVQHMPQGFTKSFAERLNELCALTVKETEDGELIRKGTVYIAKGGSHFEIFRRGQLIYTRLTQAPKEHFQRPAVDVLFRSVALVAGENALGILLTGMGKDGAKGLLAMKEAGGFTIAQDEASSVVWGMPGAAVALNAHSEIADLTALPSKIVEWVAK